MDVRLRRYRSDDLEPALALWQRAWTAAMPGIDFVGRMDWWRDRWLRELVPNHTIVVAELAGRLVAFVVIDPATGWLDQIVTDPDRWRAGIATRLMQEAMRLAPAGIHLDVNQSNERAIRFYERAGFVRTGPSRNPRSGEPTWLYRWKP